MTTNNELSIESQRRLTKALGECNHSFDKDGICSNCEESEFEEDTLRLDFNDGRVTMRLMGLVRESGGSMVIWQDGSGRINFFDAGEFKTFIIYLGANLEISIAKAVDAYLLAKEM